MERDRKPHDRQGRGPSRPRPPRPSAEERLSRLLAFVLRHHPEEVGLTLDEQGAADLDELTRAVQARPGFQDVTREQIERLATAQVPPRFEILGGRIRARYGHTLQERIRFEPADPPDALFHGTTPQIAEQVLTDGLEPGGRQYVHLSVDTPAARDVGRRHSPEPVILSIDTVSARKAGVRFYPAGPAVWLSDSIPPECITRLP